MKEYINKYPFLENFIWAPNYSNGVYTIGECPLGWTNMIFKMCEEIKNILVENNALNTYEVYEIKEKYGTLCWYDNTDITSDIVNKYMTLFSHICFVCGSENAKLDKSSYINLCDNCYRKYK